MSSKPGVRSEAADRSTRLQAEGLSRTGPPHPVSGLATAVLVGALGFWSQAGAAEFHFVVQDLGEKRALWVPRKWGFIVPRGCRTAWCSCWRTRRIAPMPLPPMGCSKRSRGLMETSHEAAPRERDVGRQGPGADQYGSVPAGAGRIRGGDLSVLLPFVPGRRACGGNDPCRTVTMASSRAWVRVAHSGELR